MWNDRYSALGLTLGGAVFDPGTLTTISLGATAAAGAVGAAGSLASGSYAAQAGQMQQQAANYQASQLEQNATQAIASGQRQALETQQKTRLAISASTARAAASGVDTGAGSPATNVGELAKRGSYQALMDMFNGQSTATGLENQAKGVRYSGVMAELGGEEAKKASYLAAGGQLLGAAGSMASTYGKFKYPTQFGKAGVDL